MGKLKLKNNPTLLVGEIEEFSDRYEIKLKFGKIPYRKSLVEYVLYEDDNADSSVAKNQPKNESDKSSTDESKAKKKTTLLQSADKDFFVDYLGRFSISVPAGFKLLESIHPGLRVLLVSEDEEAFMNVSVNPFEGDYPKIDNPKARLNLSSVEKRINRDAKVLYENASKPQRCSVVSMFETPVIQTSYTTGKNRDGTVYERRFKFGSLEYAVRFGFPSSAHATMKAKLNKFFEAFSFVPSLSVSRSQYLDYDTGFLIRKPSEQWILTVDIFDNNRPVKLRHESGQASLVVEILDRGTPESYIQRRIEEFQERPGGIAKALVNADGTRNGVPMIYRCLRGFAEKARKAREYYYFLASRVDSKLLVVRGSVNPDGPFKKILKRDMLHCLDSIQLIDQQVASNLLSENQFALDQYSEGLKLKSTGDYESAAEIFTTVLEIFPEFRQGFLNRASCYKSLKRWKDYRKDLETAQDLHFEAKVKEERNDSYFLESKEAAKQDNYPLAIRLINKAYRGNRENEDIAKNFRLIYRDYGRALRKSEKFTEAAKILKKGYVIQKHPEMKKLLIETYLGNARFLIRRKNFRKAIRECNGILKLEKGHRQALSMRDRAKAQLDRQRGNSKKKKRR